MAKTKGFNTGMFAEKVFALATYDSTLLERTYNKPKNKRRISRGAALLVKNYFDVYMDSLARKSVKSFHHIYEFDKTGDKGARLFKGAVTDAPNGAVLSYKLTLAKSPNRNGYDFPNKAEVMEDGNPITIFPKNKQYLKYELKGLNGKSEGWVMSKKSYVVNPGGEVGGNFGREVAHFMRYRATNVLKKYKFYERIEESIKQKRRMMIPRINAKMVNDAIARAGTDADMIAGAVSTAYVGPN
jgi:hypothetical protein